jgi:hypothetical protein
VVLTDSVVEGVGEGEGVPLAVSVVVVDPVWRRTKPAVDAHCGWVFSHPTPLAPPAPALLNYSHLAACRRLLLRGCSAT